VADAAPGLFVVATGPPTGTPTGPPTQGTTLAARRLLVLSVTPKPTLPTTPGRLGGRFPHPGRVAGTVASNDNGTLVLNLRSGGTETVMTSATTKVLKFSAVALSDLSPGERVAVTGRPQPSNPAGATPAISARHVVIIPADLAPSDLGLGGLRRFGGFGPVMRGQIRGAAGGPEDLVPQNQI